MSEAPDVTPEEEPAEVALPKTGAEAWKERRALILDRNRAARDRGRGHMNGHLTKKRPRG